MLAERAKRWPEQWKQQGLEEGRQEGRKQGRQEGLVEGEQKARLETACNMIERDADGRPDSGGPVGAGRRAGKDAERRTQALSQARRRWRTPEAHLKSAALSGATP